MIEMTVPTDNLLKNLTTLSSMMKDAFGNDDPSDTLVISTKQQPFVRETSGPFLVIARNGAEAKGWARERGLRASEWMYATNVEKVIDAQRHHIVVVTGWHERPDAEALVKAVQMRGGKLEMPQAA